MERELILITQYSSTAYSMSNAILSLLLTFHNQTMKYVNISIFIEEDTDSETKCLTRLTAGPCTLGSPRGAASSAQRAGRRQNIVPACAKSDVLLGKILEGF